MWSDPRQRLAKYTSCPSTDHALLLFHGQVSKSKMTAEHVYATQLLRNAIASAIVNPYRDIAVIAGVAW